MPLPSWARPKTAYDTYEYTLADSPHTATGYRIVYDEMGRTDHYSCVPPVDSSVIPHPSVLRAIHEFDPSLIVLWRKQRYLPPSATESSMEIHTHLALARHVRTPRRELILFNVEMPANATHPVPNELILIWEAFDKRFFHEGGPGGYMPPDMSLYHFLREQFNEIKSPEELSTEKEIRRREKYEHERKALGDEMAYSQKHYDAYMDKFWQLPGDHFAGFEEWKRKKRAGPDKKLMVDLRGAH
jgi:hypothetical protein